MANPSVTYTFSNGTTADASQVNQNFTDIINGLTDGTKSLTIDALSCAGTASFGGNVTLGNGSPDDITFSGSLASSIAIKTNNSFDIGAATLALGSVYLGSASSRSTRLRGHQSLASSITLTLPATDGDASDYLETDGSGNLSFVPIRRSPSTASNYALSASVATNALTVALKGADGNDASSTNPIHIVFRNATAATGTPVTRTITSALSMTVTSGATLGHFSGVNDYIYVYALDNAGTVVLAVAGSKVFEDGSRASATAVTNSADHADVLYATANHTDLPCRFLGRLQSNQATAGTYASAISEVAPTTEIIPILTGWRNDKTFTLSAGFGTTTNHNLFWRRVGDTLEVRGHFEAGTLAASTASIDLWTSPAAITIDTSKTGTTTNALVVGHWWVTRSSVGNIVDSANMGVLFFDGSDTNSLYFTNTAGTTTKQFDKSTPAGNNMASNQKVTVHFLVPITGWSETR